MEVSEFLQALFKASREGVALNGTFNGDNGYLYVDLKPDEDDASELDGSFSLRELDAIVRYKRSQL